MNGDVASIGKADAVENSISDNRVRLNAIAERQGKIVWITFSRPQKANALNSETLSLLIEAIDLAEKEGIAEVAVISGEGTNFCAGADLTELLSGGSDGVRNLLSLFREAAHRLERSHLVVLAAVHGAARAGGLEIALACDVILAGNTATFGDAHLSKGLLPGGGSTVRLPRAIGWQRGKWMILSAEAIDARQALDWGLVHKVVDDAKLLASASDLASTFCRGDRQTMRRAKRLLATVGEQPMSAALEEEIVTLEAHWHSDEFQQGVGSFLSRRNGG
ncbi:enoyl-CoA hydratase/isomerase family protein [Mesorhizobium sp. CN2-181]|uniref:enoyl-CoA hydratase/isomerase family protein n=1 Tax=Mesorhizobium yinganensis TaxID=3157707 RepID=UPI0032B79BD8